MGVKVSVDSHFYSFEQTVRYILKPTFQILAESLLKINIKQWDINWQIGELWAILNFIAVRIQYH